MKKPLTYTLVTISLLLSVCTAAAGAQEQNIPKNPADPWEGINRDIYIFNDALDSTVIRPIALGYQRVVPRVMRTGISNFFNNLDDINVIVNDVLQLKVQQAGQDTSRFLLNSTIGLAGLIDVSSELGLYKNQEDFGQTLGYWGVESGPYIVIPFIGTSTVRDAVGMIPDALFNPIYWVEDNTSRYALYSVERIDTRITYFAADALLDGKDDYAFVRDALLQRREYLVADGEVYDEFDDF